MSADTYRILDVGAARLAVRSPVASFHAHLDQVYPHHPVIADTQFADARVALLPRSRWSVGRREVALWVDSQSPFDLYPLDAGLPLFEWGSNFLLAQRLNAYLLLHAGVVARNDRAVILPAAPGSGKTTLTCALHLAGWRFLSDEFGVVDMERGCLMPMVRPAPLKNESIEIIRQRPGAVLGPLFPKTRKGDVSHFVPDSVSFSERHTPARPALVVFPRFVAGAELSCLPLPKAEAVLRLGRNSFNYQALGPSGFDAVVALAQQAPAWELVFGELDAAIGKIEALLDALP